MTTSKVETTRVDDLRILTLRGEFMGGKGIDELREALAKETQEGGGGLLIDLTEATYLDSTALGVLIGAHTSFSKRWRRNRPLRALRQRRKDLCDNEARSCSRHLSHPRGWDSRDDRGSNKTSP